MKCFVLRAILCCVLVISGNLCCEAAFPIVPTRQQPGQDIGPSLPRYGQEFRQGLQAAGRYEIPGPANEPRPITRGGGGFGTAALICGLLGIWPAAIALGIIGMSEGRPNRGQAKAGLVLGIIGGAFFLLAVVVIIAMLL